MGKQTVFIPHIGQAAAHACSKVAASGPQHQHGAAGHVFATVVASAFHYSRSAGQTHRKALARHATEKGFTTGGAVHDGVAHNDVGGSRPPKVDAGAHHHTAAGEAFAGVVVGVTNQIQGDALRQKRSKRLPTRAFKLNADGVVGQAFGAHFGERTREHGPYRAVDVSHHFHELHFLALVDGGAGLGNKGLVQRFVQAMVLGVHMKARHIRRHLGLRKQARKIQALGLPVLQT